MTLVVGDGQTFGNYYNGPLHPGSIYNFRLLAFTGNSSALMSASVSSCANSSSHALFSTSPIVQAHSSSGSGGGGAAAAAGAAVAIIAVVVIAVPRALSPANSDGISHDPFLPNW